MCRDSFALSLVATAMAATGIAAAAPAPKPSPVEFTLSMDRKSYLTREPMLAECALTNSTNKDVLVFERSFPPMYFEGTDGKGDGFTLRRTWVVNPDPDTPLITLRPGQTVRRWLQLDGDYTAPPGVGRYTMRALICGGYTYSDREHGVAFEVLSDEVSFEVVKAEGDDAEVVKRIEDVRLKDFPPLAQGSSAKERREWEEHRGRTDARSEAPRGHEPRNRPSVRRRLEPTGRHKQGHWRGARAPPGR
jgi:hypothetical protein